MSKYFSAAIGGFYDSGFHTPEQIPADAIEITDEQHISLLNGQSSGKIIKANSKGKPTLVDPPKPSLRDILASIDAQRQAAYQKEADPLFFMYQRGEINKESWLAKIDQIKERFPKPEGA